MRLRTEQDQGFTLVEVLVSLAVIGTVLSATTTFFVKSMTSVNLQGDRQAAIQLASDGMERMREVPGSLVGDWIADTAPEVLLVNTISYTRTWEAPRVVSTDPELTYVAVGVSWRGNCPNRLCGYTTSTLVSTADTEPVFDPDRP